MSKKVKDIYFTLITKVNKKLRRNEIFKLVISTNNGSGYVVNHLDKTKTKEEIDEIIKRAKVI